MEATLLLAYCASVPAVNHALGVAVLGKWLCQIARWLLAAAIVLKFVMKEI